MLAPRKLEDSEAAEQYCAEIGRADAYMQFVSVLPFWYSIYVWRLFNTFVLNALFAFFCLMW